MRKGAHSSMRKYPVLVVAFVTLNLFAWSQQVGYPQDGTVADKDKKPLANVEVVYTDLDTSRVFKSKTDKKGGFYIIGVPSADYKIQVIDKGEVIWENTARIGGGTNNTSTRNKKLHIVIC